MKKYINYFLLTATLAVTSCNFLDEEMTMGLASDNVYSKESDYELAVIGIYDQLGSRGSTNYNSNYNGGVILLNEIGTDEMCQPVSNTKANAWVQALDKCAPTTNNLIANGVYNIQYSIINRANDLITASERTSLNSDIVRRCAGEAKFLRALSYYTLVSLYGGVVCTTTPGAERADKVFPRNSTEVVYKQIFKDLIDAYNVLPVTFEKQYGRATKVAAAALMARASLTAATMGKYTKITKEMELNDGINSYQWAKQDFTNLMNQAKTYPQKVIDDGFNGNINALLDMPYEESFFPFENTPEVIFDVQFKEGLANEEGGWVGTVFGPASWFWIAPTSTAATCYVPNDNPEFTENFPVIADVIDGTEVRYENSKLKKIVDTRKAKNITSWDFYKGGSVLWPPQAPGNKDPKKFAGKYQNVNIGKFAHESNSFDYNKQKTPINVVVLRLAEAYLILAEVDAELNGRPTENSFKYLNIVRERAADPSILTPITAINMRDPKLVRPIRGIEPANDLEQFRIALLQERMMEFICEGIRRVDLIRSGWMAEYLENTNVIDYDREVNGIMDKYMVSRRDFQDWTIFLPIPQDDVMNTNQIIQQNFGY